MEQCRTTTDSKEDIVKHEFSPYLCQENFQSPKGIKFEVKCDICNAHFPGDTSMAALEMKKHKTFIHLICSECNKMFDTKVDCYKHNQDNHPDFVKLLHQETSDDFEEKHESNAKMTSEEKFECKFCKKEVDSFRSLNIHFTFTHLICTRCNSKFKSKAEHFEHYQAKHPGANKCFSFQKCHICNHLSGNFVIKSHLTFFHLICHICNSKFKTKEEHLQHFQAKHPNASKSLSFNQCSKCDHIARGIGELKRHLKAMHQENCFTEKLNDSENVFNQDIDCKIDEDNESPGKTNDQEDLLNCKICNTEFSGCGKRTDQERTQRNHKLFVNLICKKCNEQFHSKEECFKHFQEKRGKWIVPLKRIDCNLLNYEC